MTGETETGPSGLTLSTAGEGGGPNDTRISASRGLAGWLARTGCSLAFTSYQTGRLFLVGRLPDGRISFHQQDFARATGLHVTPRQIYLGSLFQVWRLENVLAPHERANGDFDRLYVPRLAQTTGDIDLHELALDGAGRLIFVATRYNCLATLSPVHGFRPVWKPAFISGLAGEDRCHLNGLAMGDGVPAYATAISRSDIAEGWRSGRSDGGILVDVRGDRIVAEGLSMPHSPRVETDGVWLLESGRGMLVRIDPATGAKADIAFCPGFLRGLALHAGYAITTLSHPREGSFAGLPLQGEIARRGGAGWCGLGVIDLKTGDMVEWIRLDGAIGELFDVAVIPDAVCPMAVGPHTAEIRSLTSFENEFAPLTPPG
jgi:uncharacterized protein (TIGR03032 family)